MIEMRNAPGFRAAWPKVRLCALPLTASALLLQGCVSPVRSDYDAKADLGRCHRVAWQESSTPNQPAAPFDNPLNVKRLHTAVDEQLRERGMTPTADAAQADCLVGAAMGVRDQVLDEPAFAWGAAWGWGRPWGGLGWGVDEPYVYREGRVSVDLFDARTREPLWHATTERDLTSLTGSDADRRIRSTVNALFQSLPGPAR